MSLLPRSRAPEMMDRPDAEPEELARSLADLRAVNRWLGGTRMVLGALRPMIRRVRERPIRVLDVATGSADIPLALARWARGRGLELEVTATDFHQGTVEVARGLAAGEPAVTVERADALDLPYADGAFHFATCSTALHHFDPEEAVQVLREMSRVASRGIVVSDLRRGLLPLWGTRALASTVWRRHPITRHDGPVSVRASYTPDELAILAQAAGLPDARIRTQLVYRLTMVVDRTRAGRR